MNTIGIERNLDRPRIRKLLAIGLLGSVLTGAGDWLIGYGPSAELEDAFMRAFISQAPNVTDAALIAGGLLGVLGIFLEGLSFFGIYRLMADAAPRYAHIYRAGIFFYIWLAPIGCHMNLGLVRYVYKYLLEADPAVASAVMPPLCLALFVPVYVLLAVGWVPMIVVQWKAFAEGKTPYPRSACWFNLFTGAVPTLIIALALGPTTALGNGIGTAFLSVGNAVTFGGLLATMPGEEGFEEFRARLDAGSATASGDGAPQARV